MQLERLSVELRPRGGWESIDLGFQMAHRWRQPVWGAWLAVYLPAAVVLHAVFYWNLVVAALVLWWLKPVFDRFVLHVVSRAVFGERPTVRATLAAWREILTPGLAAALTIHRLQPARSSMLPVWQLEHQAGREAAARRRALGRRLGGGTAATVLCVHFEAAIFLSVAMLAGLLAPAGADAGFEFSEIFRKAGGEEEVLWWSWYDSACYVIAVSVIEPLYVAAGFALYLNRRAVLEGWDIELQLRRLDERLRAAAAGGTLALVLGFAVLAVLPQPVEAQERSAREEIRKVLEAPEFQEYEQGKRWAYRGARQREPDPTAERGIWKKLAQILAELQQFLLWTAAAAAVVALLYVLRRWLPQWRDAAQEAYRAPDALFGLALAPESLPEDVAGAALAFVREGRRREALSLLYRGALSVLVHRDHVPLTEGHTEGDCVRAARGTLAAPAGDYFARLVQAWTGAAYAHRLPDAPHVESLCREWAPHFAAPRAEAAA